MANNPVVVSSPNNTTPTASGTNLFLSSYPLLKLDTTSKISFQTIKFTFNNEPPGPSLGNLVVNTKLFSFAHGYKYIPATWMVAQNPNPVQQPNPPIGQTSIFDDVWIDETEGTIAAPNTNNVIFTGGVIRFTNYTFSNSTTGNITAAALFYTVDNTNVTFYIQKESEQQPGGVVYPVNVQGIVLNIRFYVFADDIGV